MRPSQYDTSLAEFTYTVARNVPLPRKRYLPEKLFRLISTEKGAMRFATRSTEQEKREFFAYLGLQNFWVIADIGYKDMDDFRDVFAELEKDEKPRGTLKKLTDKNIFITSSKELCYRLGYMAQLVDTKPYSQNLELVRTTHQLENFKAKLDNQEHTKASGEKENATNFLRLMFGSLYIGNVCGETTGLDCPTIQVLMYLYLNRHVYLGDQDLLDKFSGILSPRQITASKKTLFEGLFIQRHASTMHQFTITARGISAVNQFRDKVVKILNF